MTETSRSGPPNLGSPRDPIEAAPDSRGPRRDDGGLVRLERALSAELARLEAEFAEALSDDVVVEQFESCVRSFESARIRLYVPVLSYRNARQALRARARSLDVGRDDDRPEPSPDRSRSGGTVHGPGARARQR